MTSIGAAKTFIIAAIFVIAGYACVVPLTQAVEANRPRMSGDFADSDLHLNASGLRGFAFGAEGLLADIYYMRALQYIGDKILASEDRTINLDDLRSLKLRLLYPLLDKATDLDPQYNEAYSYGAIVLPAVDADSAVALATKGVRNNPNDWRLYQHLGYIYWKLERYPEAAEIYQRGSEIPSASPFMKMMAANMSNQGGSRGTARAIYADMIANTHDVNIRTVAELRLSQLNALDQIDVLNATLKSELERTGTCASDLNSLIPQLKRATTADGQINLLLDKSGRVVDPTGAAYLLNRKECKADIDRAQTKLPITE